MGDALLRDAATVTLLVHGVGDHSSTDILGKVKSGAQSLGMQAEPIELKTLGGTVADSDSPRLAWQVRTSKDALALDSDGRRHVVLPLVWSQFRSRTTYFPSFADPLSIVTAAPLAVWPLTAVGFDCIRCIPRARSWWRLVLLCIIPLVLGIAGLLVIGARAAVDSLTLTSGLTGIAVMFGMGYVIKYASPALDFVGDVMHYVGSSRFRDARQEHLAQVVENVMQAAPCARIIVVGHSLGTVLAAQALLRVRGEVRDSRLLLVTLGSPLRIMSSAFADTVQSVDQLMAQYRHKRTVGFWANLWRDGDFIGRALRPTPHARYTERSLGAGPHWNIWSDKTLWSLLPSLLDAAARDRYVQLKKAWRHSPLTEAETAEVTASSQQLSRLRFGGVILLLAYASDVNHMLRGDIVFYGGTPVREVLTGAWCLGLAGTIAIVGGAFRCMRRSAQTREWLAELRLREMPFWMMFALSMVILIVVRVGHWAQPT